MRRVLGIAIAAVALVGAVSASASAQDDSKAVKDGGIKVKDWMGKVDAREAASGLALKDQLFAASGSGFHVTTGPATTYWMTTQNLKGDYTVSATFDEAKQTMDHPHPFGIFVAGKNLESDKPEGLYCSAYRNGTFIFRGFSSTSTARGGVYQPTGNGRGQANAAVQTAADKDSPVKQSISVSVKGDKVSCTINGVEVQSYTKAEMIGDGKLSSLDGFVGLRFAHNTDAQVTNWKITK